MAASSRFVTVSEDEIENFKENAVPKSTKIATKFGVELFKGIIINFHVVFLSLYARQSLQFLRVTVALLKNKIFSISMLFPSFFFEIITFVFIKKTHRSVIIYR